MNYFYSTILGVAGALLISPGSYAHPDKSVSHINTQTTSQQTPPITIKNGSLSSNLQKWNISPERVPALLNSWLDLDGNYSFEKLTQKKDAQGIDHIAYQAFYNGMPIDNSIISVHAKNGIAHYLTGHLSTVNGLNTNVSLTPKEAVNKAKEELNVTELVKDYPAKKVVLNLTQQGKEIAHLAYRIKIASQVPLVLQEVYIDAQSGKMLKSINKIYNTDAEGTGKTLYYGEQDITVDQLENDGYRLKDNERNIITYDAQNLAFGYSGITGEVDFINESEHFNGLTLEELEISELSETTFDNDSTYYYQIQKGEDEFIYSSDSFSLEDLPLSLENIGYEVWNFDEAYQIQVLSSETDALVASADFDFEAGTLSWDSEDITGSYTVSEDGNPAVDVHWGMEQVHDFYKTTFDWDSFDNEGSLVKQYVNPPNDFAGEDIGLPNNAFALESPFNIMVYGMGDNTMMSPLVAIDVAGHEFTHLIVAHNGLGGLDYEGEPGALNESFADIFGTSIEFFAAPEPNWEIGESVAIAGSNLRSMEDPKNGGLSQQPDTYEGQYWVNPENTIYDNGGVHFNSGVQNYWFYLLSEGGSGTNDSGDDYEVEGLGIEEAQQVAYTNLMNYMNPLASFHDSYIGAMQAAKDLYELPSHEYTQTAKAWYAVGLADNPEEFCAGTEVLTDADGMFEDGSGDDEDYVNNAHCGWLIQPEEAEYISLHFLKLDTEEDADIVVIYDGEDSSAPVLGEFSGNEIPEDITTTGGSAYVEFYSDQADKSNGWKIKYAADALSVDQNELENALTVFPNPTDGIFNVTSDLNEETSLEIFDITGKQVRQNIQITNGTTNLDISELNAGVYFLQFKTGKNTHTEKLILN